MKIYLAGAHSVCGLFNSSKKAINFIEQQNVNILESYFYAKNELNNIVPIAKDFLLDSGAFTILSNNKISADWDKYINGYAKFINENKITKFFELDIDYAIGYENVIKYRNKLETLTKQQCIPVWHKTRGIKEFEKMCQEYSYIAIGSSGRNEDSKWLRDNPDALRWLIRKAHSKKCKVHGLGFTSLKLLKQMPFDSVDSTTWLSAGRFGITFQFTGSDLKRKIPPKGKRLKNTKEMEIQNYIEWAKYSKWAEKNL